MYDGARFSSPEGGNNRVPVQHETLAAPCPSAEEGEVEPVLVKKKVRREILDHDRKRRVELKCMELQEMMEEQGYSEEEIRQKVGTFRQMLMEKEGVIARDGMTPRPPVRLLSHEDEEHSVYTEDCEDRHLNEEDQYSATFNDCRSGKRSSSSTSPRPKKRKKKKARRHSRTESTSPGRREKKKSHRKHKRNRSESMKNKHKDKSKKKKRSSVESTSQTTQYRDSVCSSRSRSVSSIGSRSPDRSYVMSSDKHKHEDGHASNSPVPSPNGEQPITWQNGNDSVRLRNGRESRANHSDGSKVNDNLRCVATSPSSTRSCGSPRLSSMKHLDEGSEQPAEDPSAKRGGRPRTREKTPSSHSSDRELHLKNKKPKKAKMSRSAKRRHRVRAQIRQRSSSASPASHTHTSHRRKKKKKNSSRQRSSSWSSQSTSQEHNSSKNKSPHNRQNNSRERESPQHSDPDRSRHRSRSYSPIRKRRRDSPSFMEARRITSARKRPIPYYRPSPSSSSSCSSSRSRSYSSYSSYSSRSPSVAHSYSSHSSGL